MLRDRFHLWTWRLAKVGIVLASALVLIGGGLAGSSRSISDLLVLAGFGLLIPSVMLAWLGLPAASNPLALSEESLR